MRVFVNTLVAVTTLMFALLGAPAWATSLAIPEFTPNVVDANGFLDAAAKERVNLELQRIRDESHIWGAVFIVDTLNGEAIEDVATETFKQWKLGQAGVDNGLLLVLAINDRKSRFEVGYGLEGSITDVAALHALDGQLAPKMRQDDVAGAIVDAFGFLSRVVAQDPDALRELEEPTSGDDIHWKRGFIAWGIFIACLWGCVPLRNLWVDHRRAALRKLDPTLSLSDEGIVKTADGDSRWQFSWFLQGFLSLNPGFFVCFLSGLFEEAFTISIVAGLLTLALVLFLSGRRYGSPERYRKFLQNVARKRADLIGQGHVKETSPGIFSYTPAYFASRASSSSSSSDSSSSSSSSSGGGRSGGGGASSGW